MLANGLAVPTCAFGVLAAVLLFVDFACPGESVVQSCFGDFVVVVDELPGLADDVVHIACRVELVGVPG